MNNCGRNLLELGFEFFWLSSIEVAVKILILSLLASFIYFVYRIYVKIAGKFRKYSHENGSSS